MNKKDSDPIVVVTPSTIKEKMDAIVHLSSAIQELSKAINSTNVNIDISSVYQENCKTGIKITHEGGDGDPIEYE